MALVLTILVFILIFSTLVLLHEWGHFVAARRAGIKVEEFGFGLPPRIWGVKKGEVIYSLNAIPFGGFVRLLGEDAKDAKALKNPRSFISKKPRVRMMVVLAGVAMNFILAVFLLTIGFSFGMQPLISSAEDVYSNIDSGGMQVEPGVQIKEVLPKSPAALVGLKSGDKLLKVNGKGIESPQQFEDLLKQNGSLELEVLGQDGQSGKKTISILDPAHPDSGVKFYDFFYIPQLVVDAVSAQSGAENLLFPNDVILSINGKNIYSKQDYFDSVENAKNLDVLILRNHQKVNIRFALPVQTSIVLTDVITGSSANAAGLLPGDKIVSIDGKPVYLPIEMIALTHKSPEKVLSFVVLRGGNTLAFNVVPNKDGLIGVSLAQISPYQAQAISFYVKEMPLSVLKINDVRFPVWQAPFEAVKETGRLSLLTVQTFIGVVKSFVTRLTIPEGVAGPVGIFQMTGTFVQEGLLSVLRFMALLSLSLGIINVLPIPALDGGRLLFIVVEVIIGRKIDSTLESTIHGLGFAFLMLLILMVTYSDILKLF